MTDNTNVSNAQMQEQVDRLTVLVESLHSELTELRAQATNGSPLLAATRRYSPTEHRLPTRRSPPARDGTC